jgi:hypothetical protein
VDGTSGNTWLRLVDAVLIRTRIQATGGVVEREGQDGRTVLLDVSIADGRIEDVLRLAAKADQPALTGTLKLRAKFILPPGDVDAMDKLRLDGTFEIGAARFTKSSVQAKVNELSQKAQGKDQADQDQAPADEVLTGFTGRFAVRQGVIRLSNVRFRAPGAVVTVGGDVALKTQALDLRGTVQTDAKPSEMTSGVTAFFLKLLDPLLRRDHVTVIPFKVAGTTGEPHVSLDAGRLIGK